MGDAKEERVRSGEWERGEWQKELFHSNDLYIYIYIYIYEKNGNKFDSM